MKTTATTIIALLLAIAVQGQTLEQVRAEIRRRHLPHPDIVLAQARLETGNFKSRRCKADKNLFGLKHRGRYAVYGDWRQSVADYERSISSRYPGGDYYRFLRGIGYAKDPAYCIKLRHIVNTTPKTTRK